MRFKKMVSMLLAASMCAGGTGADAQVLSKRRK